MSANIQNCNACKYKHIEHATGHCYMFEKKPCGVCAQFTHEPMNIMDLVAMELSLVKREDQP